MLIFWNVTQVLSIAFENFMIIIFLKNLFKNRYDNKKSNICCIFFLIISSTIVFLINGNYNIFLIFVFIVFVLTFSVSFFNGKITSKILFALIVILTIAMVNICVTYLLSYIFGDISLSPAINIIRLVSIFISKFLQFTIIKLLILMIKKENIELKLSEYSISVLLFAITYLILISLVLIQLGSKYTNELIFLSVIGISITNVIVFFMLKNISSTNKDKLKISLLELQLSQQKTIFQEASYISKEIKKSEHDLKHHLGTILDNLEDENYTYSKKYLRNLLSDYETNIFKYIFIDNSIVNSVLNLKIAKCHKHNIDIKLEIQSDFKDFDDSDICVLLSNILDNAIEASINEQEPSIHLIIKNKKNYLYIVVKNKISKSILKNNKNLKTTKNDKSQHGLGLYSVSQICQKYDGQISFQEEKEYFITDIWLKTKHDN